jgi:hypothetical protein
MQRTRSWPVRFSQISCSAATTGVMPQRARSRAAAGSKTVRRIDDMLGNLKIRAAGPL